MNQKTILVISLITALAGITVLYFLSGELEPDAMAIEKITGEDMGEIAKITGEIKSIRNSNSSTFITIEQPADITIIAIGKSNLSLKSGDTVEILGAVDEYNDEPQIIAKRIRLIE